MQLELLEELMENTVTRHRVRGLTLAEALGRAGEEMLTAASRRLGAAELFCYRLCLRGAGQAVQARLCAPCPSLAVRPGPRSRPAGPCCPLPVRVRPA